MRREPWVRAIARRVRAVRPRQTVALLLLAFLVASTALPALAAPAAVSASPISLSADHIDYDTAAGTVVADGHVKATQEDVTITADHLAGNLQTGEVDAQGHVTLVEGTQSASGDSLMYNYRTRVGHMGQVTTRYGPWNVKTQLLDTQGNGTGTARMVTMTPCDPTHPFFHVTSDHVLIVPDEYFTAYNSSLYVYGVRVVTLPVYTASLKKNRQAQSGPTFGYNNLDGLFIDYAQWFPLGDVSDQLRFRYGTITQFTTEDVATLPAADHTWTLHLGRQETYDQNGNLINLNQNSLSLYYDTHPVDDLPDAYEVQAHYGDYDELATGVDTTRADGIVYLQTRTLELSNVLSLAASAYYEYDYYGTGVQRNVFNFSTALTQILNPTSSVTLSYNSTAVTGVAPPGAVLNGPFTPFEFDSTSPDSSINVSYSYYPSRGLFQSGTLSFAYDFYGQQLSANASVNFQISPSVLFTTSANYTLSTGQLGEVDFAVNATCDCLSIGLLYRVFPSNPSTNTIYITLNVNTLAGVASQFQFGPTPR